MNHPLRIAQRGIIPAFIVMEVLRAAEARAADGGDVLHLEIGQPSTPAPTGVRAAAHAAIDADKLGYTDEFGLPALRRKLADFYHQRYGVTVPIERIAITVGSSGAFLLTFLAAFDAGNRVALAAPSYPAYRNILSALGVEVVELPATLATGFQPTIEMLEQVDGPLHGLIVASPANPTGTMLSLADYQALIGWCRQRGVTLISDEIYHGLTYGKPCVSALQVSDEVIVINSFSKYFSMTGWRLGWTILPEAFVRPVECLAQNMFISAPSLSQHAAMAAFDCIDELEINRSRYATNRDHLLAALRRAGIRDIAPADGALYLYADVGHLTNDTPDFCRRLLNDTGVAITPGIDFDPERGHRYVRFSFAGATDTIIEAGRRFEAWVGQHRS